MHVDVKRIVASTVHAKEGVHVFGNTAGIGSFICNRYIIHVIKSMTKMPQTMIKTGGSRKQYMVCVRLIVACKATSAGRDNNIMM